MKCYICKKELTFASVEIRKDIKTHLDCFYDDEIPNVSESTNEERYAAITAKVKRLIEQKDNE